MITAFLLDLLYQLLNLVVSILPQGFSIPQQWIDGVNYFWGILNGFSWIVPIQTILAVLIYAIDFHILIFLMRLTSWVLKKIPFVN